MNIYFIDTNIFASPTIIPLLFSGESVKNSKFYIIDAVIEESGRDDLKREKGVNTEFLSTDMKHLEKVVSIMSENGKNLELISLFENKGAGDILILAHILYMIEKEQNILEVFRDHYYIVSHDNELKKIGKKYNIEGLDQKDFLKLFSNI